MKQPTKTLQTIRTTAVPGTQLFDALLVFVWLEVFMEGTSCPCAITQGDGQMWETNGNMSTCCHQGCATQWHLPTSRAEAASRCSLILMNKRLIAANGRNMVSSNFCFNLRLSSYWSVWESNWGTYSDIRPLLVTASFACAKLGNGQVLSTDAGEGAVDQAFNMNHPSLEVC